MNLNILQTVKGVANLAKQIGDIELNAKIIKVTYRGMGLW